MRSRGSIVHTCALPLMHAPGAHEPGMVSRAIASAPPQLLLNCQMIVSFIGSSRTSDCASCLTSGSTAVLPAT